MLTPHIVLVCAVAAFWMTFIMRFKRKDVCPHGDPACQDDFCDKCKQDQKDLFGF